jgi:GxxExxY protein
MEVHRDLGPGLDESFYHALLSRKLLAAGLPHLSKPRRSLSHRGMTADVFESDLVFPEQLIAEFKCLTGDFDGEHYVQLICYLKFWKIGVGLLFDFGKESLSYRRVQFSEPQFQVPDIETMLASCSVRYEEKSPAPQICAATQVVLREHGLGYRDTTYSGLLSAEFLATGLKCVCNCLAAVRCDEVLLGESTCPCLVVNDSIAVRVLALRRNISAADEARLRTYLRLLGLHHGIILNFNRTALDYRWIARLRDTAPAAAHSNLCPPKSLGINV